MHTHVYVCQPSDEETVKTPEKPNAFQFHMQEGYPFKAGVTVHDVEACMKMH